MTPDRIERFNAVLDKRQPDLTVVTDYVHKGRNLSAIVRTADAVGIMAIHCAMGEQDYRKFRGTAMGSHSWVDVHRYASINEPVAQLKNQGFQVVATHLSTGAVDFHEVDYSKPTALLLGSEKTGISDESEALADIHVTIPMSGMVQSLNVSVAAGIILMEASHQRQQKSLYAKRRIDQVTYDRLFFEWAHPKVREFCRYNHLDYPPLRADGEIDKPSEWYASMRELLRQRQASENRARNNQVNNNQAANGS